MTERLYNVKQPDDLPPEKLNEMRHQLNSISPSTIITQALLTSKTLSSTQKKRDELLESTRIQSITKFMANLKRKSLKDIKIDYIKQIEEYQTGVKVIIEKTKKENMQYISQYNSVLETNVSLRDEIAQLNYQYAILERQLNHSEEEIHQLQARFNLFNEFKALFEELFKEFPNLSPKQILDDIRSRREEGSQLLIEYNNASNNNETLRKENAVFESKAKRQIQDLSSQKYQLEAEYKEKEANFEKKKVQLENDLSRYKEYKGETIVMHKMLYSLYNLLIETLRLNRDMKVNEELDIKESDFTVDMLNSNEIIRYVKVMIQSLHYSSTDKLLREIIAYSNMMVRTFMKDKINKKFDPVDIFKEIKKLLEAKQERIIQLEHHLLLQREANGFLEKDIKKNLKLIDTLKRQNETMKSNNEKGFHLKVNSRNNLPMSLSENKTELYCVDKTEINEPKDKRLNNKPFSDTKTNKGYKKRIHNNNKHDRSFDDNLTSDRKRKSLHSQTTKLVPIYTEAKLSKESKRKEKEENRKLNRQFNKKIIREDDKDLFNDLSSSSYHSDNNSIAIKKTEIERFKDIKIVPNKDKLVKSHGFQATIKTLSDFKQFVNQTNRLFFYKAKMQKRKKLSKVEQLNNKHQIENRFLKQLSFDNIKKHMKTDSDGFNENRIKDKILFNIKRMIKSIKAAEEDNNN